MRLLSKLRKRKKQRIQTDTIPEKKFYTVPSDKIKETLSSEIKDFFPKTGHWTSNCFNDWNCLQCRLRDNAWMSELLFEQLIEKGINIPKSVIKNFMDNSSEFNQLRHNYELEIVKWQIEWMSSGGENWLLPDGFEDEDILFSPDVDKMFREGVVLTLSAINLNREVVEEGLEKFANLWRDKYMESSFNHLYEKFIFLQGYSGPADEQHKQNWLKLRRYKYYQKHKNSVDKYGEVLPEMKMTDEEVRELAGIVYQQNAEREQYLQNWEKSLNV